PAQQPASVATTGGNGASTTEAAPSLSNRTTEQDTTVQSAGSQTAQNESGKTMKASPLARRMAEEHSIELSQVKGTGPGGRIVRDDIEDVLEQRAASPAPSPTLTAPQPVAPTSTALSEAERVKLSRVQLLIARRLTESKQTIPHFYVS